MTLHFLKIQNLPIFSDRRFEQKKQTPKQHEDCEDKRFFNIWWLNELVISSRKFSAHSFLAVSIFSQSKTYKGVTHVIRTPLVVRFRWATLSSQVWVKMKQIFDFSKNWWNFFILQISNFHQLLEKSKTCFNPTSLFARVAIANDGKTV